MTLDPQYFDVRGVTATWYPDIRRADVRLGAGKSHLDREDGRVLTGILRELVGDPPQPYSLLVDLKGMLEGDAGWRAAVGKLTIDHRDVVTQAFYNAGPVLRVTTGMFLRSTRVKGKVFATEVEARVWLDEVTSAAVPARQLA